MIYCANNRYGELLNTNPGPGKECKTYKFIPHDISLVKHKKLLFLDLNAKKSYWHDKYYLDKRLMKAIYNIILKKYEKNIVVDESSEEYIDFHTNSEDINYKDFLSAYGYNTGCRDSELHIDRFFTLELFHIINDLKIMDEDSVFMGYYHNNIYTCIENNEEDGYMLSEFAIPYRSCINKNYMKFCGVVANGTKLTTTDMCKSQSGGNYKNNIYNKKPYISKKSLKSKRKKTKKIKQTIQKRNNKYSIRKK